MRSVVDDDARQHKTVQRRQDGLVHRLQGLVDQIFFQCRTGKAVKGSSSQVLPRRGPRDAH